MYSSPLKMRHDALGANWKEHFGSPIVADYGETVEQREKAVERLAVIDLSPLPRQGIKGEDLSRWIDANSFVLGDKPNVGYPQDDGSVICRLSMSELLVLANVDSTSVVEEHRIVEDYRCYTTRRQDSHCWFAVTGQNSAALFAKICGVDLSIQGFPENSVAQTSVARVNAIVLRHDVAENPVFHVLADSSYALYLWNCILDATEEFDGQALGIEALRTATRE